LQSFIKTYKKHHKSYSLLIIIEILNNYLLKNFEINYTKLINYTTNTLKSKTKLDVIKQNEKSKLKYSLKKCKKK